MGQSNACIYMCGHLCGPGHAYVGMCVLTCVHVCACLGGGRLCVHMCSYVRVPAHMGVCCVTQGAGCWLGSPELRLQSLLCASSGVETSAPEEAG